MMASDLKLLCQVKRAGKDSDLLVESHRQPFLMFATTLIDHSGVKPPNVH